MTYLPLTIQASSDGVAIEPGIGGSGCGARTMTPLRSSPRALAPQHSPQR